MTTRTYGQFCGVAHALELIGERWALLVVRDLIVGPKRFTELRRGLPRIPTNILSTRLKELEDAGVICRRVQPRPAAGVAYELTPYGRDLEDIVLRLGLWGLRSLGEPRPDDVATAGTIILGLRAAFRPEAARDLRAGYEIRRAAVVIHARVDWGALEVGEGPLAEPDLVIETPSPLRPLLAGELSPAEAIDRGYVRVRGDMQLLTRFVEVFRIPSALAALPSDR